MKRKLNREVPKGKVVYSKRRILLSLFLFLIAAIIGVKLCGEAEKERKEEKRYEEICRKKDGQNKKLKRMYPDMVGWIEVKDSALSYPVMQTKEVPEYYLNRNEKGGDFFSGKNFFECAGYAWNALMQLASDALTKNPATGTYKDIWESISTIYTTLNAIAVSLLCIFFLYGFCRDSCDLHADLTFDRTIKMILSILVYTFFSRMFDLMLPPGAKHSIAVA